MISQAEVARAVRGALKGFGKRAVASVTTQISEGSLFVTVTAAPESPQTPVEDGVSVEAFKDQLRRRHAARRA